MYSIKSDIASAVPSTVDRLGSHVLIMFTAVVLACLSLGLVLGMYYNLPFLYDYVLFHYILSKSNYYGLLLLFRKTNKVIGLQILQRYIRSGSPFYFAGMCLHDEMEYIVLGLCKRKVTYPFEGKHRRKIFGTFVRFWLLFINNSKYLDNTLTKYIFV